MKNGSANNHLRPIIRLLDRYNLVIIIIIVAVGLVGSIYILTNIINRPYTSDQTTNSSATTFDQAIISSLSNLEVSSKNSNHKNLPSGRIDPFSE